jgi:hypothetical protein
MKTKLSDDDNMRRRADLIHYEEYKQMVKIDADED